MTKLALRHLKRGWTVYSTDPIPGCILIPVEDVAYYEMKPRSLLIIDEIGMIWHARNHKTFPPEVRNWFKLQRHRQIKVICASQSFDIDKGLRDLADEMWLLQKKFRVFCYGKRILKVLDIIEASGDSESRVVDQLKFDSVLFAFLAPGLSLTFRIGFLTLIASQLRSCRRSPGRSTSFPMSCGLSVNADLAVSRSKMINPALLIRISDLAVGSPVPPVRSTS